MTPWPPVAPEQVEEWLSPELIWKEQPPPPLLTEVDQRKTFLREEPQTWECFPNFRKSFYGKMTTIASLVPARLLRTVLRGVDLGSRCKTIYCFANCVLCSCHPGGHWRPASASTRTLGVLPAHMLGFHALFGLIQEFCFKKKKEIETSRFGQMPKIL